MKPLLHDEFQNPPARARLAPFWFWNCGMAEAKVRHQVRQMAEAGCGGFFIHPRQGLTLPYLSREWFARVRVAVEEARQCGLEAWLYDEYPYPSGIAGGLLTANHPEFRSRQIQRSEFRAAGHEAVRHDFPLGRVVCAVAYPMQNGRVNWDAAIDLREEFGVVLTREQFWYWPMGHIPTNEKRFMADEGRLVMEWVAPEGEWRIWVGIEREQRDFKYYNCFFDPLCPGAATEFLRLTHERYKVELGEFFGTTIPGIFTDEIEPPTWSPEIEKALELDWSLLLPALFREDHPEAARVRFALQDCALRLFQERWEAPLAAWCHQNGLIWGAEKPTWRPAQFWPVHEPATDAGHRRIPAPPEPLTAELRANHRAAIAAAEQSGTETVRCECFHSLGWGATLQDQKWSFDWLCAQGVNRFTPHAFYATSAGLTKHDAAPSFFAENPYWTHFHLLADYVGRLSLAMSAGRERANIAVLYPHETLWIGGEASKAAERAFEELQNELLARHFLFHPVDGRALLEAKAQDGALEIGHARYEILLVPAPVGIEGEAAIACAQGAGLSVWRENLLENLEARRELSVRDENGREIAAIWTLWRQADGQELLFLANTSGVVQAAHLKVMAGARSWEEWSLESGGIAPIEADVIGGTSRMVLELAPYASVLLVGTAQPHQATQARPANPKSLIVPVEGEWELTLDRPNALRLNRWEARTASGAWRAVEALPLRHLDQRGNHGWRNQLDRRPGETVWYRRVVECEIVPEDLEILIEDGAIAGDWALSVNETPMSSSNFLPHVFHGEDKVVANVAALFQRGTNTLTLRVDNAPEMGGLRTPLHLLGSFGLAGESCRVVVPLPRRATFNGLVSAGLPHFSGVATYSKILDLHGALRLELPGGFGDVAEMRVAGTALGARAWSPYVWNCPPHDAPVQVEIGVTNTLLAFFEGQWWDGQAGVAHSV